MGSGYDCKRVFTGRLCHGREHCVFGAVDLSYCFWPTYDVRLLHSYYLLGSTIAIGSAAQFCCMDFAPLATLRHSQLCPIARLMYVREAYGSNLLR